MGKKIQFSLFFLVLLFWSIIAAHAFAQNESIVSAIKIEGNKRVDNSTFLYYIKTQTGEPLSRTQISKDIEQLHSLGQFKDIRVETRESLNGLEVVFIVEEIPSIGDVILYGTDEVSEEDIREKIGLRRGMTFQEHMIKEAKEQIKLL